MEDQARPAVDFGGLLAHAFALGHLQHGHLRTGTVLAQGGWLLTMAISYW